MARTLGLASLFSGDEYDMVIKSPGGERLLEAETVEARHRNVQHGAARRRRIMLLEEFPWRRVGPNIIAPGAKQSRQPIPNARVVIDEIDSKFICHDAVASQLGNGTRRDRLPMGSCGPLIPANPLRSIAFQAVRNPVKNEFVRKRWVVGVPLRGSRFRPRKNFQRDILLIRLVLLDQGVHAVWLKPAMLADGNQDWTF